MATSRWPTLEFVAIDVSALGDTTIVAADTAGRKIKVLSYLFVAAAPVSLRFRSGGGADLSGPLPCVANSGAASAIGLPDGQWLMETAVEEALVINLSAAVAVGGHLSYFLEP